MNVEMNYCERRYVKNSNDEVCDGHLAGFCVQVHAGIYLCVGLFETVDVT